MKNLSLRELNLGLSNKKFSSEELTKFFLNEIKTSNPKINALLPLMKKRVSFRQGTLTKESAKMI